LLQTATCNIIQFIQGSVWADAQLTVQTPVSEAPNTDQVAQLLVSGSQNYQASVGVNTSYSFDDTTLQVQLILQTPLPYSSTNTSNMFTNAYMSTQSYTPTSTVPSEFASAEPTVTTTLYAIASTSGK
uniref:SEA domain-containing protein n=1 Tax=Echinostoma caproni TaxID=27848 RepID=A0A183BAX2_9TREM